MNKSWPESIFCIISTSFKYWSISSVTQTFFSIKVTNLKDEALKDRLNITDHLVLVDYCPLTERVYTAYPESHMPMMFYIRKSWLAVFSFSCPGELLSLHQVHLSTVARYSGGSSAKHTKTKTFTNQAGPQGMKSVGTFCKMNTIVYCTWLR